MPSWPSTLPNPSEPYDFTPTDPRASTDMEMGAPRTRRRFTGEPTLFRLSWVFNQTQMSVFEAWFHHTLMDGAQWFTINLFNGLGYQPITCKFQGMWNSQVLGPDHFVLTAALLAQSRPILTSSQLQPYL